MPSMPTYQPTYQPMDQASMPAAPLPPQSVKRPLTISAPDDGSAGSAAQAAAAFATGGYGGDAAGDAQRAGAAGGGRRYSSVARAPGM
jgi:hypothetical protein